MEAKCEEIDATHHANPRWSHCNPRDIRRCSGERVALLKSVGWKAMKKKEWTSTKKSVLGKGFRIDRSLGRTLDQREENTVAAARAGGHVVSCRTRSLGLAYFDGAPLKGAKIVAIDIYYPPSLTPRLEKTFKFCADTCSLSCDHQ